MTRRRNSLALLIATALISSCGGGNSNNDGPSIGNTSFATDEDQPLNGQIPISDPTGGSLALTVTTSPAHGSVTASHPQGPSASFTYQPGTNYFGSDSFGISVVDNHGRSANAVINVTVRPVNDAPVAAADTASTSPGFAVTIPVLANDTDVETASPVVSITTLSPNGAAVVNGNGSITFTPQAGFAGSTSIQYRLTDEGGANSGSVAVIVAVGPQKKVVFLSGSGPHLQLQYYDGTQSRAASGECGLQSPRNPNACQRMWKAAGTRGFLFQGRITPLVLQGEPPLAPHDEWRFYDYANEAQALSAGSLPIMVTNTPLTNTVARLSPAGVKVLMLEDVTVGSTASSRASVVDFLQQTIVPIHDTTGATQIRAAEFSPNALTVLYRSNNPATGFDVALQKVGLATSMQPAPLLGPLPSTISMGTALRQTPNGLLLLNARIYSTYSELRAIETSGSMLSRAVGPQIASASAIGDFSISPDGRHVAFVTTSSTIAPVAYLHDLQTDMYWALGSGFAAGTTLTAPRFRGDSTHVMLHVSSATESALYEAAIASPAVLTRISASYSAGVAIPQFEYSGSKVVYVADLTQPGLFGLFVAQGGSATRLNTNPAVKVEVGPSAQAFRISDDGSTILYSQVDPNDGMERVFMIDVSTPGFPVKLIAGDSSRARGQLPLSLGFDFYP